MKESKELRTQSKSWNDPESISIKSNWSNYINLETSQRENKQSTLKDTVPLLQV